MLSEDIVHQSTPHIPQQLHADKMKCQAIPGLVGLWPCMYVVLQGLHIYNNILFYIWFESHLVMLHLCKIAIGAAPGPAGSLIILSLRFLMKVGSGSRNSLDSLGGFCSWGNRKPRS